MRLVALLLLLAIAIGCEGSAGTPRAASMASTPSPAAVAVADEAAQRACSAYRQGPLWDSRDIDTNGDGADDFTEVFTASGSDERVLQIAEAVELARRDSQLRPLAAAFDFLASVHKRGGDRSEVAEADVRMTGACANLDA